MIRPHTFSCRCSRETWHSVIYLTPMLSINVTKLTGVSTLQSRDQGVFQLDLVISLYIHIFLITYYQNISIRLRQGESTAKKNEKKPRESEKVRAKLRQTRRSPHGKQGESLQGEGVIVTSVNLVVYVNFEEGQLKEQEQERGRKMCISKRAKLGDHLVNLLSNSKNSRLLLVLN